MALAETEMFKVEPRWGRLIEDVTNGVWVNPDTGQIGRVPFERVVIANSLADAEAMLVRSTMPAQSYAVVSDKTTYAVQGAAVVKALGDAAISIILEHPHADEGQVAELREKLRGVDAVVAVGSGTINDLCKYVTSKDGRPYCVFATAPSMNGYTSTTASITLESGLKTTQKAHGARGVFIDLEINAAAPKYLIASGFGDAICRPTAQVDWYFSHRMLDTAYQVAPFALQLQDEAAMLARSAGVGRGDPEAIGYLHRLLTLGGFGIAVAGMSHPGSMGEHTISHWMDSFAGARHPGTVHGQQVGLSSITMARLQERMLAETKAPQVRPTLVDEAGIRARYPAAAVEMCLKASRAKAMDQATCDRFNQKLEQLWPELRQQLQAMSVPADTLAAHLRAAGGGATPQELGMDPQLYRDAVLYGREIRDRYSFLDLAADMGILEAFVQEAC
jgi:glycerol-1-phosphate dehydrogenase [NAD(P)+]